MDAASRIWGFESWDSQKYKIIKFKGIGYILNLPKFGGGDWLCLIRKPIDI